MKHRTIFWRRNSQNRNYVSFALTWLPRSFSGFNVSVYRTNLKYLHVRGHSKHPEKYKIPLTTRLTPPQTSRRPSISHSFFRCGHSTFLCLRFLFFGKFSFSPKLHQPEQHTPKSQNGVKVGQTSLSSRKMLPLYCSVRSTLMTARNPSITSHRITTMMIAVGSWGSRGKERMWSGIRTAKIMQKPLRSCGFWLCCWPYANSTLNSNSTSPLSSFS